MSRILSFLPGDFFRGMALLIGVCLFADGASAEQSGNVTEEQRKGLTVEAKRLGDEAERLEKEGKLGEAVMRGEKKLAIHRQLHGNVHLDVATDLEWLAKRRERQEDFSAAKKDRREVLEIQQQRVGKDHWQTADAQRALARGDRLAGLTPDKKQQLRQANELNDEMSRLVDEGKYREAIPVAE